MSDKTATKPQVVNLAAEIQRKRDAGAVPIELAGGEIITIDPPELWPDEWNDCANDVEVMKLLLGDDKWDQLRAEGATTGLILDMVRNRHGADAGESSASSDS